MEFLSTQEWFTLFSHILRSSTCRSPAAGRQVQSECGTLGSQPLRFGYESPRPVNYNLRRYCDQEPAPPTPRYGLKIYLVETGLSAGKRKLCWIANAGSSAHCPVASARFF